MQKYTSPQIFDILDKKLEDISQTLFSYQKICIADEQLMSPKTISYPDAIWIKFITKAKKYN